MLFFLYVVFLGFASQPADCLKIPSKDSTGDLKSRAREAGKKRASVVAAGISDGALARQQRLLALQEKLKVKANYLYEQALAMSGDNGQGYLTESDCAQMLTMLNRQYAQLEEQRKLLENLRDSFTHEAKNLIDTNLWVWAEVRRHAGLSKLIDETKTKFDGITSIRVPLICFAGSEHNVAISVVEIAKMKDGLLSTNLSKQQLREFNDFINQCILFLKSRKTALASLLRTVSNTKFNIKKRRNEIELFESFFTSVLEKKKLYDRGYEKDISQAKTRQSEQSAALSEGELQFAQDLLKLSAPFSMTQEELDVSPDRPGRRAGSSVVSFSFAPSRMPSSTVPDDLGQLDDEEMAAHIADNASAVRNRTVEDTDI